MKRIVIITDAWYPQINGVVTTFAAICPLLEKRGYAVSVIHPALFRTIPLPFYPEIRLAIFPRRRLQRLLQKIQPNAIHIATEGPLGLAGRHICRSTALPFTTSYHTHFEQYVHVRFNMFSGFVSTFMRWFHAKSTATMVATESLKSELEARGFQNIAVWPLGVDIEFFVRNPSPPLPLLPKPVFVFFGRLASEKSTEEFLALPLPGTKLVIGDGPDRPYLEKKYGHTARFVGYKHGRDLVNWLSLCDVCIFPSRTETFGLVVLEALACGIPVVAHDVMGPRDIITTGIDGFLSDDLAAAARKALALKGDSCRKTALRYTWKHSTDVFLKNLAFTESIVRS